MEVDSSAKRQFTLQSPYPYTELTSLPRYKFVLENNLKVPYEDGASCICKADDGLFIVTHSGTLLHVTWAGSITSVSELRSVFQMPRRSTPTQEKKTPVAAV